MIQGPQQIVSMKQVLRSHAHNAHLMVMAYIQWAGKTVRQSVDHVSDQHVVVLLVHTTQQKHYNGSEE